MPLTKNFMNAKNQTSQGARALIAVIGTGACAAMIFNILPVFLGKAAETFALSDSAAGLLATVYLLGFGASSASAVLWLHRVSPRGVASAAYVGAGLLLLAGAWLDDYFALTIALGAAGLFLGALYSLSFVLAGAFKDPVRAVGFKLGGEVALGAVLIFLLPTFVYPAFGFAGMLISLALVLLASSPFVLVTIDTEGPQAQDAAQVAPSPVRGVIPWAALVGLLALLVFTIAQSALWSFVERAAIREGHEPTAISTALSTAVLMGGIGAMSAAALGTRFGRSIPVFIAAALYGLALWGMATGARFSLLAVGFNLFFFVWLFALPYFTSVIAEADASGRGNSLVSACFAFGSMTGPAVAGTLVSGNDFSWLYVLAGTMVLLALSTLLMLTRRQ